MPLYKHPGILARALALAALAFLVVQYFLYFRSAFSQEISEVILPSSFLALLVLIGAYVVEGSHAIATQIKAILLVLGLLFILGAAVLAAG
ncbi:MAG: hypothetical protein HYW25_06250 [Candidatus Aenigmarchaeota archaeon]|nr:hypothetical protein [Candidatus Aenigmarchaeota archaeon]